MKYEISSREVKLCVTNIASALLQLSEWTGIPVEELSSLITKEVSACSHSERFLTRAIDFGVVSVMTAYFAVQKETLAKKTNFY